MNQPEVEEVQVETPESDELSADGNHRIEPTEDAGADKNDELFGEKPPEDDDSNSLPLFGTPLPEKFPAKAILEAAGFTTIESLPKNPEDLIGVQDMNDRTVKAVFTKLKNMGVE
jgi:hypothetical protein